MSTNDGSNSPGLEKSTSRLTLSKKLSTVHPSFRSQGYNPAGYFRTFANPIPIGLVSHAVGSLIFGSYCANWRSVSTPLLISTIALTICAPGLFLSTILAFIVDDTFWGIVFIVLTGLWGFLGLAYLPATGILAYYTATPALAIALYDSIALILVWYGIFATAMGVLVIRRNVAFPAFFFLSGVALFLLSATYFKHEVSTSNLSKGAGYLLVFAGLAALYYVIAAAAAAETFPIQFPLGHGHDPLALSEDEEERFYALHLGQRRPEFQNVSGKAGSASVV